MMAVACWLPSSTCWLPSPAYWLLPVGFHIYLACLFSLSPAGWLSPAGIQLSPADLRLLASCSLWLACLLIGSVLARCEVLHVTSLLLPAASLPKLNKTQRNPAEKNLYNIVLI